MLCAPGASDSLVGFRSDRDRCDNRGAGWGYYCDVLGGLRRDRGRADVVGLDDLHAVCAGEPEAHPRR